MKTEGLLAQRIVNVKSSAIRELLKHSKMEHVISLAGGIPSDALFDFEGLSIATQQAITEQPKSAFQYGLTEGSPLLRERICALCAERGVTARAEEVMVTAGSQQALDLVMRAIVNPGDVFVVERPTYLAALQTLELAEANGHQQERNNAGAGLLYDQNMLLNGSPLALGVFLGTPSFFTTNNRDEH